MTKPILCIYHNNCADGFGAAWVVRKALGEDQVEFYPGIYQTLPPDTAGRDVVIVDFSYKWVELMKMGLSAKSILVIDHHKSAAEDLRNISQDAAEGDYCSINAKFSMDHSGAILTWKHYFPDQEPPVLLKHIEDRDLWRFALPGTREIQANLFSHPYDFNVWDELMQTDMKTLIADGKAIERKHFKDIDELLAVTQRRMVIGGHDVPVANLPYTLVSDAGHKMAQGEAFAACYWDTPDRRCFGLRSTPEGLDVSEIAKQYGGGGHRNAAGFQVPYGHELAR